MILHTCNKGGETLEKVLQLLGSHDSLLLLEDGVYAAMQRAADGGIFKAAPAGVGLYVLGEDLAARGISDRIRAVFSRVDHAGFVNLCLTHTQVVNWH